MLRYVVRRLVLLVPILIGLSILVFVFVRSLPGGPAIALLGERATEESVEAIERDLGLDEPIHEQYLTYAGNLLQGDLGASIQTRRPVIDELKDRFPATIELGVAAMLFAILAGVPLGYVAAKRYQGFLDQTSLVASLIGISFPIFFATPTASSQSSSARRRTAGSGFVNAPVRNSRV